MNYFFKDTQETMARPAICQLRGGEPMIESTVLTMKLSDLHERSTLWDGKVRSVTKKARRKAGLMDSW